MRFYMFVFVIFLMSALSVHANNIALNKVATAISELNNGNPVEGPAAFSVDGIETTLWNAGTWAGPQTVKWLKVDLLEERMVGEITLKACVGFSTAFPGYYIDYKMYSSVDNQNWGLIGQGRFIQNFHYIDSYQFDSGINLRYLRYDVIGGTDWAHLNEIEVYDIPEPCTLLLLGLGGLLIRKR